MGRRSKKARPVAQSRPPHSCASPYSATVQSKAWLWYEKRSPKSEDDWVFYATVLSLAGDKPGAAEVAKRGIGTFPDSEMLKQYAKDSAAGGEK